MSAVAAYFTARNIPVYANRFRLIQTRVNGSVPASSFRTWAAIRRAPLVADRMRNSKTMAGGAVLIMAGVAMYPSGRHSLYPGIPIPVTSLNRTGKDEDTNEQKLIVVEKLEEPRKTI